MTNILFNQYFHFQGICKDSYYVVCHISKYPIEGLQNIVQFLVHMTSDNFVEIDEISHAWLKLISGVSLWLMVMLYI